MKLPGRVIDVVRGIGGAALLCAAGCGASPQPTIAEPEEIAVVQRHNVAPPKPEPEAEVETYAEEEQWTYPDQVHPACGRG